MITLVDPPKEWWEKSLSHLNSVSTEIKTKIYNNIHPELPIVDLWQQKQLKMTYLHNFCRILHILRYKDPAMIRLLLWVLLKSDIRTTNYSMVVFCLYLGRYWGHLWLIGKCRVENQFFRYDVEKLKLNLLFFLLQSCKKNRCFLYYINFD